MTHNALKQKTNDRMKNYFIFPRKLNYSCRTQKLYSFTKFVEFFNK